MAKTSITGEDLLDKSSNSSVVRVANDADECVQNCRLHPECGGVTFTKKDDSWEAGLCHLKSRSIAEPYLIGALKTEADMKSTSRVLLQDLSSLPKELDAIPVCSPAPSEAHAYHRRLQLLPGRKRAHTSHGCVQARARSLSSEKRLEIYLCFTATMSGYLGPGYSIWGAMTPSQAIPSIRWVQEVAVWVAGVIGSGARGMRDATLARAFYATQSGAFSSLSPQPRPFCHSGLHWRRPLRPQRCSLEDDCRLRV